MNTTKELLDLIILEQQSQDTFMGMNNFMGSRNVFGGQAVAQALNAATRTVSAGRICHSLHCYFILPGDLKQPIIYQVQNIRDGGSFTTRYVTAKQNNVPIFILMASFHKKEQGNEHQITMPDVPAPETLDKWLNVPPLEDEEKTKRIKSFIHAERPIELRSCYPYDFSSGEKPGDVNPVWFRFKEVPEKLDWIAVQQLLAYASDYNILATALRPHQPQANYANTHVASLDHALWFHHETDLTDWLLFDLVSPVASGARGYATGQIFNRSGKLVASVAQEGLLRPV